MTHYDSLKGDSVYWGNSDFEVLRWVITSVHWKQFCICYTQFSLILLLLCRSYLKEEMKDKLGLPFDENGWTYSIANVIVTANHKPIFHKLLHHL